MQPEEIDIDTKCCINCKFFDKRTSFCRLNPPQVVLQYVNRIAYPTAAYPKISVPALDWCSFFENYNEKKLI